MSARERQAQIDAQNRAIQLQIERQRQAEAEQRERERWNSLTSEQQHAEIIMKQKIEMQKWKALGNGLCLLAGGC